MKILELGPSTSTPSKQKRFIFHTATSFLLLALAVLSIQLLATICPRGCLSSFAPSFPFRERPTGTCTRPGDIVSPPLEKPPSREQVEEILLDTPSAEKAREWSLHYTSEPHLLGEGERFANWTLAKWQSFGLAQTSIVEYPFPIPFTRPTYQKLALLSQKSNYPAGGGDTESQFEEEEVYNARLRENTTYINPVSGKIVSTPQFLLNTPNGDVTAQYVYVNFGTAGDYDDLERLNIELRGKIVIRKQGGPDDFRALETARDRGVVGMIAYLDPQFDGNVTEANGYRGYPEGPARSPHSIFRRCGIVPTRTLPNGTRVVNTVQLPVTPISYTEAVPFLRALNGHGPLAADIGAGWRGGQLGYLGVEYNVGPSPESLVVHLVNEMESSNVSAYNVIGIINGTLDNEAIILGNHRDALGAGAGDSNSGSAAFNEVIRSFGIAMKRGWKPLRTIVFASWDGHEAGTWGSGFWVQHHLPWLSHASVAYLEVETAGTGTEFFAKASPLLHNVLHDATRRVLSPDQTRPGQRVRDGWDGRLKTQAGGDTTYFLLNGIASMSFGFAPADTDPVFHWHSDYDTVEWIDRYGDPTWGYHGASAQVWALAAAWLAGDPIIPFNITAYAVALDGYLKGLRQETGGPEERPQVSQVMPSPCSFNLEPLSDAISRLVVAATAFDTATQALREHLNSHSGTSEHIQNRNSDQSSQIARVNNKYKLFERQFVYRANAPGAGPRHVIYSPSSFKTDMPAFPELTLAIRRNDWCEAEKWQEIITSKVEQAARFLES